MVSYHNIMGFMYVFARYLLMGARNCWGLSSVLFLLMAALAFLYEDEVFTRIGISQSFHVIHCAHLHRHVKKACTAVFFTTSCHPRTGHDHQRVRGHVFIADGQARRVPEPVGRLARHDPALHRLHLPDLGRTLLPPSAPARTHFRNV